MKYVNFLITKNDRTVTEAKQNWSIGETVFLKQKRRKNESSYLRPVVFYRGPPKAQAEEKAVGVQRWRLLFATHAESEDSCPVSRKLVSSLYQNGLFCHSQCKA